MSDAAEDEDAARYWPFDGRDAHGSPEDRKSSRKRLRAASAGGSRDWLRSARADPAGPGATRTRWTAIIVGGRYSDVGLTLLAIAVTALVVLALR